MLTVVVIWIIGGLFARSYVFEPQYKAGWNWENGHEEAEVRKDLDILRKQLGNEGMAGRLAKTIECIEEDISDEMCDTSESFAFDAKVIKAYINIAIVIIKMENLIMVQ